MNNTGKGQGHSQVKVRLIFLVRILKLIPQHCNMYFSTLKRKQISFTDCIRVFIVYNCCRCIQKITITKWLQGRSKATGILYMVFF